MRELEFLPGWYPTFRRRQRLVKTQAWATAVTVGAVLMIGLASHQRVSAQERVNAAIQQDLTQTRSQLKLLDEQLELKKQLDRQGEILSRIGLQVEFTRLIGELDALMGQEMFLIDLNIDTDETIRPAVPGGGNNPKARPGATSNNKPPAPKCDRKLKIKMVAISPTDVDVANFLAGLTNKPFFDQVAMTYAKDRIQQGRLMREFELTFLINLNSPSAE